MVSICTLVYIFRPHPLIKKAQARFRIESGSPHPSLLPWLVCRDLYIQSNYFDSHFQPYQWCSGARNQNASLLNALEPKS